MQKASACKACCAPYSLESQKRGFPPLRLLACDERERRRRETYMSCYRVSAKCPIAHHTFCFSFAHSDMDRRRAKEVLLGGFVDEAMRQCDVERRKKKKKKPHRFYRFPHNDYIFHSN